MASERATDMQLGGSAARVSFVEANCSKDSQIRVENPDRLLNHPVS